LQALLRKKKSTIKEIERQKQESKYLHFLDSYINCKLDIRKRSAAIAAEEDDDDDDDDELSLVPQKLLKKRKQALDQDETQLADALGSDLPTWDDDHTSTELLNHSVSPFPSPTPEPETSKVVGPNKGKFY